jgi:hypothetical protein
MAASASGFDDGMSDYGLTNRLNANAAITLRFHFGHAGAASVSRVVGRNLIT